MVFNNAHEDHKINTEVVVTASGQYLHQFEWTDKIDRILTNMSLQKQQTKINDTMRCTIQEVPMDKRYGL